jgi:hypothetical protein
MCEICNRALDRRTLLRAAGAGGVLAAVATAGGSTFAEAYAPVFEGLALGEDARPATALIVPAPVAPAAAAPAAAAPAAVPPAPAAPPAAAAPAPAAAAPPPAPAVPRAQPASAPEIVTRAEWGADESLRVRTGFGYAPIRKLVVHHTGSPNKPRHPRQVVRDLYRYHVRERKFADIGYNFIIDHHGVIYEGRWARDYGSDERHTGEDGDGYGVIGAHAQGSNAGSCGVCLIGDFSKAEPTYAAVGALLQLLSWKAARHQIDPDGRDEYIGLFGDRRTFYNIVGHRGVGDTECPGPGLIQSMDWIRAEVRRRVGGFQPVTLHMGKVARYVGEAPTSASGQAAPVSVVDPAAQADAPAEPAAAVPPASSVAGTLVGYRVLMRDGRIVTVGDADTQGTPHAHGQRGRAIAGRNFDPGYLTLDPGGRLGAFAGASVYSTPQLSGEPADLALHPKGDGYWIITQAGGIYGYGSARHHGSPLQSGRTSGALKIHPTPSGEGYWVLAGNGDVLAFGDAPALGGARGQQPVDLWGTTTGQGYWLLLADGRVLTFGDARHRGDLTNLNLRWTTPAVGLLGMPSGRGYLIASADGGLFSFGSAPFFGSLHGSGREAVGVAPVFVS